MSNLRLRDFPLSDSFENAFRRFLQPVGFEGDAAPLDIRLDVNENDQAYTVKADIPGVRKEDIHVRVDGNMVRIDAECRKEQETRGDGERVLRSERYYGNVSRSFNLAQDVDDQKVEARYQDGVLQLTLPKKPQQQGRRITVE